MVKVFHVTNECMNRTGYGFGFGPTPEFPNDYEHVANVRTDELGEAFQLTNTIDAPWWENEGVEKLVAGGRRSTSVGDIAVLGDTPYRCEMAGWSRVAGR